MTKKQRDKEWNEASVKMKKLWTEIEKLDTDKDRNEKMKLVFQCKKLLDKLTNIAMVKLKVDLKEEMLKDVY